MQQKQNQATDEGRSERVPDIELTHIYERIIDVMRALQRNELASEKNARAAQSEGRLQGHAADAPASETGNKP